MADAVTLPEVAALFAVAQDHAFGQTPGSQLRATVLADGLALAAGADDGERATTWRAATLRYLGCTGHAFETAVLFGDEIELRAESLRADFANPVEMLRMMLSHAGPGESFVGRLRAKAAVVAGGRKAAVDNFTAACEVADAFAVRLGVDADARAAIAASFERWNGRGLPIGLKGTAIPRPMRFVQLAQELEVLARVDGIDRAIATIESRRDKAYEPGLVDLVVDEAPQWYKALEQLDPWDEALAIAPAAPALGASATQPTSCSCSPTSPTSSRRGPTATRARWRPSRVKRADPMPKRLRSSTTSVASRCRTPSGTRAAC